MKIGRPEMKTTIRCIAVMMALFAIVGKVNAAGKAEAESKSKSTTNTINTNNPGATGFVRGFFIDYPSDQDLARRNET